MAQEQPVAAARPAPNRLRRILLLAGPVALLALGLWLYLGGGGTVSEDDAYVGAPNVMVTTQVLGQVSEIAVEENSRVAAGQRLFRIDPEFYEIAVQQAAAELQSTKERLDGLVLTYKQSLASVQQSQADVAYAQTEFDRAQDLVRTGVGTQASADQTRRDLKVAQDQLLAAEAAASSTLASLGGATDIPTERQADYLAAAATLATAERNLRLSEIKAPFAGLVTQVDNIQIGSYLVAGQAAFSLVSTDSWVDANVKETDLVHMKVGNSVSITLDNYPGLPLKGTVESIAPASGSVFSLLPPQNASGNWVKVVQRIPVRIKIENVPADTVLRVGSSATVDISTGYRRTFETLVEDVRSVIGL
jgi:membrane fusion protein (multidrug efflux system)